LPSKVKQKKKKFKQKFDPIPSILIRHQKVGKEPEIQAKN
jgi:hypothetical protein